MAQVISFEQYRPVARYDATAWTQVRIEESDSSTLSDDSVWTELETQALSPVDADPENPAYRDFTTELASDDPDLWYRIIFVDGSGDESLPTAPVQNTGETVSAYATVDELARILKIRTPTDEQTLAMERVLLAASGEINSEIDLAADVSLAGWQVALASQVCLERAAELWKLQEVQFGIVMGSEFGATHMARNTWDKHAYTLAPLKDQWGIAEMPSPENVDLLDAMADLIREALDDVGVAIQVEPRMVSAPSPPTIDMYPGDVSRGVDAASFGVDEHGKGEFLFTVRARVNENDADANQDLLLAFMDDVNPMSIAAALDDDPTLGGLAHDLDCIDPTGYVLYPVGGETLLGFQFTCRVLRADS